MSPQAVAVFAAGALAAALLCGCYGDVIFLSDQPLGDDDDVVGADAGVPIPDDIQVQCADSVATSDDGHHFPGTACLGCHDGSVGPAFSVGGTLYDALGGEGAASAIAGATVHVIDADRTEIQLVTSLNGNFWTDQSVAFPLVLYVSTCPDAVPMPTLAASGDCNNCHGAGDSLHLP